VTDETCATTGGEEAGGMIAAAVAVVVEGGTTETMVAEVEDRDLGTGATEIDEEAAAEVATAVAA